MTGGSTELYGYSTTPPPLAGWAGFAAFVSATVVSLIIGHLCRSRSSEAELDIDTNLNPLKVSNIYIYIYDIWPLGLLLRGFGPLVYLLWRSRKLLHQINHLVPACGRPYV